MGRSIGGVVSNSWPGSGTSGSGELCGRLVGELVGDDGGELVGGEAVEVDCEYAGQNSAWSSIMVSSSNCSHF